MSLSSLPIANVKNQWLLQHVDVKYPTKESLEGKALYEQRISSVEYDKWDSSASYDKPLFDVENVYRVDFHRLTVMFSLLQSSQWKGEKQQANVLEFFTQIILSPPCELYIAFLDGEPSAAAIVTESDDTLLISDIVVTDKNNTIAEGQDALRMSFVTHLIGLTNEKTESDRAVYIELK
ncbi:flavodoxin [Vibrio sp. ZSDE26]|uniref:Flavodoxin n=1 Tax=Vibrio amylolyticus TaxID=2847292 RepID=A0A9X2BIA5_9VIBR|nr:flavodoxin [Vibrio amylolyticus]MCK6263885.1 flavodoxin [Vibrio amylolyticus]